MAFFDPRRYGAALVPLLEPLPLAGLGPGKPNGAVRDLLASLSVERSFGQIHDRSMAQACLSGLWLLHDFLDESHAISQDISSTTGSYWHGILHRREPDAANAAYWFRQVGEHPIFAALAKKAESHGLHLPSNRWSPFDFIDLCEKHRGTGAKEETLLRQVQRSEWELLFDWCFQQAIRSSY